ncbi:MAG: hypothetical protein EZS28_006808 [Streblomastix strix]|uniref:Uncharacterized protein n=1 Tax=Streblomastix strix TaxID=222440 RepID=A0A5J4WTG5_9EUKA|nr:MAG: hypothetical protein EZS28_006808 [Streblomastix strix]
MLTNVEKPIKSTNTLDKQYKNRVRRQLVIDSTADADCQQGTTGGNLKGNSGFGDKVMEHNIPRALTEWRMEKDLRLQDAKQGANYETLQDDRHMRYDLNAEKRGTRCVLLTQRLSSTIQGSTNYYYNTQRSRYKESTTYKWGCHFGLILRHTHSRKQYNQQWSE